MNEMPIENERKFVLNSDDFAELEQKLLEDGFDYMKLIQAYINDNRIRQITYVDDFIQYFHTFKYNTPRGLVEIENKISKDDFDMLLEVSTRKLNKTRYSKKFEDVTWDVDFLKSDDGSVYFAMAEAEFKDPERFEVDLLPILQPYLLHAVSKEESKYFTNNKLCDQDYARKLLMDVTILKISRNGFQSS